MNFVTQVRTPKKVNFSEDQKKRNKELHKEQIKEESELVKGIFKNVEAAGGSLEFAYRGHEGDINMYKLEDGESYTIPIGVARHINRNCRYKKSKHLLNREGRPAIIDDKPIQRYQFISDDFM